MAVILGQYKSRAVRDGAAGAAMAAPLFSFSLKCWASGPSRAIGDSVDGCTTF